MFNPFSKTKISHIFRFRSKESMRIKTRESTKIEFKESFNWANKSIYAKTMAAFSNAKGGYIIFGVTDSPREAKGLVSNNFEDTDEEKITSYLNENFSPEIKWNKETVTIRDKIFGLIYIFESENKPIVCTKNDKKNKESDIYYRYNGRSEKIKYAELKSILVREREKEKLLWMDHISKIASIGANNITMLDLNKGALNVSGKDIFVDENILEEINFIREGEFNEVKGAKTLKVIGEVKEISGLPVLPFRTKKEGIRTREIIEALLSGKLHEGTSAREYLDSLPYERSKFMPIFIFLEIGDISKDEAIKIFKNSDTTDTQQKTGLIERINDPRNFTIGSLISKVIESKIKFSNYKDYDNYIEENDITDKKVKRSLLYNLMVSNLQEGLFDYIDYVPDLICETVTLLTQGEIEDNREFLKDLLLEIFDSSYGSIAQEYRYAISHIDELLYRSK